MDKNGHGSFPGEALGEFMARNRVFLVPTNFVHTVLGLGRGTWDRQSKTNPWKNVKRTSQQVLGRNKICLKKKTKTKITALARSIDLKSAWTDLY